jgi:hypothetical protein
MTYYSPAARPTVAAGSASLGWWDSDLWKRFLAALLRALSAHAA